MPDKGEHRDLRCLLEPRLATFVAPRRCGQIQDPAHDSEREVDGLVGPAFGQARVTNGASVASWTCGSSSWPMVGMMPLSRIASVTIDALSW
jgi:hypothetical protein